jgi:hypothetical protein
MSLAQTDWTSGHADIGMSGGTDDWGFNWLTPPELEASERAPFFIVRASVADIGMLV